MIRRFFKAGSMFFLMFFFAFGIFSLPVFAQLSGITLPTAPSITSISLSASNPHPHPNDSVTLTVQSYTTDLSGATITWFVNGKQVQSGIDLTTYNVTMGPLGSTMKINVSATDSDGTFSDSLTLSSTDVDLLWQARTYTPLFYAGKALFTNESDVVLVAIPNFSANGIPAGSKKYTYTWTENGTVLGDLSGYGKDSIVIEGNIIVKPVDVSVQVASADGSIVGSNSITLFPQSPQVLLYEDNPLYGILLNQAIPSNINLAIPEFTLRAVPYFFSTNAPHSIQPLSFSWQVNSSEAITKTTNDLTLRQPGNTSGQSTVNVSISNSLRMLQLGNSDVTINFNPQQQ